VETYLLDEQAERLLERHAAWWQRKGSLISATKSTPLGDLWLPLSDGTLPRARLWAICGCRSRTARWLSRTSI
jgi:hypothetical protein